MHCINTRSTMKIPFCVFFVFFFCFFILRGDFFVRCKFFFMFILDRIETEKTEKNADIFLKIYLIKSNLVAFVVFHFVLHYFYAFASISKRTIQVMSCSLSWNIFRIDSQFAMYKYPFLQRIFRINFYHHEKSSIVFELEAFDLLSAIKNTCEKKTRATKMYIIKILLAFVMEWLIYCHLNNSNAINVENRINFILILNQVFRWNVI